MEPETLRAGTRHRDHMRRGPGLQTPASAAHEGLPFGLCPVDTAHEACDQRPYAEVPRGTAQSGGRCASPAQGRVALATPSSTRGR